MRLMDPTTSPLMALATAHEDLDFFVTEGAPRRILLWLR
jgi:hypothetical protein